MGDAPHRETLTTRPLTQRCASCVHGPISRSRMRATVGGAPAAAAAPKPSSLSSSVSSVAPVSSAARPYGSGASALAAAAGLPGGAPGAFDILVTNAGGPPAGGFRDWDEAAWLQALGWSRATQAALEVLLPVPPPQDSDGFNLHVVGLAINFMIMAAALAFFVTRLARMLRAREGEIQRSRPDDLQHDDVVRGLPGRRLGGDHLPKLVHLEPVEDATLDRFDEIAGGRPRIGEGVAADERRPSEHGVVELARLPAHRAGRADDRARP